MQFSKLYDVAQTRALDKALTVGLLTQTNLIEIASKSVLAELKKKWPHCHDIGILCGPGGNGADGFCLADFAISEGLNVTVYLLQDEGSISEIGRKYLEVIKKRDVKITLSQEFSCAHDVLVDAVFGLGINRQIRGHTKGIFEKINSSNIPVIAIDVPSGVYCDNGKIDKIAFKANRTLALHRLKPCHVLLPGKEYSGQITLLDIKIANLDKDTTLQLIERPSLKLPTHQMHKYSRGELLIIASREMFGASKLTTLAASQTAFKSGAGIVKLLVHENDLDIYKYHVLEEILLTFKTVNELKLLINDSSTIVFGCGLKNTKFNQEILNYILARKVNIVFDAGAFSMMSNSKEKFKKLLHNHIGQKVLTPHFGEFSKIFRVSDNKINYCLNAAKETDSIILLKGNDTVVANKNGNIKINYFTTPFLATAGTGDILAGLIGGFLAQGYSALKAACYGCYIHSQSALKLDRNFVASELIDEIPHVIRKISK